MTTCTAATFMGGDIQNFWEGGRNNPIMGGFSLASIFGGMYILNGLYILNIHY